MKKPVMLLPLACLRQRLLVVHTGGDRARSVGARVPRTQPWTSARPRGSSGQMQLGLWDLEPCLLVWTEAGSPGGATRWARAGDTVMNVQGVTILASFIPREVLNQRSQEPSDPAALAAML